MLSQEVVLDNTLPQPHDVHGRHSVPPSKATRSDVAFPLLSPRKRAPSMASVNGLNNIDSFEENGQTMGVLTIRATNTPFQETAYLGQDVMENIKNASTTESSLSGLPLEVQEKVLDFIFGDMHSVYAGSTSLRGKSVSSLMRHPRRKAVSDLALVSATWRELVQERIFRHIKIKGTRAGLKESEEFFCDHLRLTKFVRHIEFWVPVWGDKASFEDRTISPFFDPSLLLEGTNTFHQLANFPAHERDLMLAIDLLSFSFKLSAYSATLSEIFFHVNFFFPYSRVLTLEGGHCKNSNMIRQFPKMLFSGSDQRLESLPNIRTFAMRGAWNIMREYGHWKTIEDALPNVEEWHCGYAKPRFEADATINDILTRLPSQLKHVNISLDGMYSKDPTTLGSSFADSPSSHNHQCPHHLCENLGRVLPNLESLAFTGKICECLWTSAFSALSQYKEEPRLKHLEIVVISCCRQRITKFDPETGDTVVHELGGVIADGAGISNLVFIRAFERLVLKTVDALPLFPNLEYVRLRFIDLDSPCTLLNPYWLLEKNNVYGIWNEEIVERLNEVAPHIGYVELGDGIECAGSGYHYKRRSANPVSTGLGGQPDRENHGGGAHVHAGGGERAGGGGSSGGGLYPKTKPKSIKTSSYKIIAEARGQ